MIRVLRSADRGETKDGPIHSKHSFSFGQYTSHIFPSYISGLRAINEVSLPPAGKVISQVGAFHSLGSREIIYFVLEGELSHTDSSNNSTIKAGEVQIMTSGISKDHKGIRLIDANQLENMSAHYYHIRFLSNHDSFSIRHEKKNFAPRRENGSLTLIACSDGKNDSLTIHAPFKIYVLDLSSRQAFEYLIQPSNMIWVQILLGKVRINDQILNSGDGAFIRPDLLPGGHWVNSVTFDGIENVEILILELHV